MELTGTQKALAAREAELREAAPAAQQLPGAQAEARRLQAQVRAARPPQTLLWHLQRRPPGSSWLNTHVDTSMLHVGDAGGSRQRERIELFVVAPKSSSGVCHC